jgi:hypothetical protein
MYKQDSRREVILKAGSISFQGNRIVCFVLNISAWGAGIVIDSDAAIPFSFDLEISDEHVRRRCMMVWRNDRQIGVTFDTARRHLLPRNASHDAAADLAHEMER